MVFPLNAGVFPHFPHPLSGDAHIGVILSENERNVNKFANPLSIILTKI